MEELKECQCDKCKSACMVCPGWFLPGEAEVAAKYMKLSLKEFFDEYLAVNWWEDYDPIFVLAPVLVGKSSGIEYPANPNGTCIFFNKNKLCDIHKAKPYECAELMCNTSHTIVQERHKFVADEWKNNQQQIYDLLGREPISEDCDMFDLLYKL